MKKILLILASFLFLFPTFSFATSGACSYHGGVNCNIRLSSGHVMCNDSWTNSSVYYSDMDECKFKSKCSKPVQYAYCSLSSIESRRQNALNSISSNRAILARSGSLGTPFDTTQAQIDSINTQYDNEMTVCKNLLSSYDQQSKDYTKCLSDEQAQLDLQTRADFTTKLNAICNKNGATGFIFNKITEQCECPTGNSVQYSSTGNYCLDNDALKFIEQIKVKQTQELPIQTSVISEKITKTLKLGMRDKEVTMLQEILGMDTTGYFGTKTKQAVIRFQRLNNLPATGLVGEMTREVLNK